MRNLRAEKIKELKSYFDYFKTLPKFGEPGWDGVQGFAAVTGIQEVSYKNLYELKDEIMDFLDDPFDSIREAAVSTLGYLKVPEFIDRCYFIFLNDEEEFVRNAALRAWASYHHDTQSDDALTVLHSVFTEHDFSVSTRTDALIGFLAVAGDLYEGEGNLLLQLKNLEEEDFEKQIDTKRIMRIYNKYMVIKKP